MTPIIVLFGLRGSGKSTLGRVLAVRLGCHFTDLDDRVRSRLGAATIAEAFRGAGEPAFREAEFAELKAYLAGTRGPAVLALGGGTPTHAASRALLEQARAEGRARLVLLDAAPAVLGARVSAAPGDRPLLVGASFLEEAAILHERRMPIYRALADAMVRTDGPTPDVAEALVTAAVPGA